MSIVNNLFVNNNADVVGNLDVTGTTTASSFISNGGLPSEFVKGDGSLDPNRQPQEIATFTCTIIQIQRLI